MKLKSAFAILVFVFIFISSIPVSAESTSFRITNWEYRTGESPTDKWNIPIWASEPYGSPGWAIRHIGEKKPWGNMDKKIWIRTHIPIASIPNPVLFMSASGISAMTAYIDGIPILSLQSQCEYALLNNPIKIIPLKPEYMDKTLTIAITSTFSSLFIMECRLGDQMSISREIFHSDIDVLFLGGFFALLSLIAMPSVYFLRGEEKYAAISLFLYLLVNGLWLIFSNFSFYLIWDMPFIITFINTHLMVISFIFLAWFLRYFTCNCYRKQFNALILFDVIFTVIDVTVTFLFFTDLFFGWFHGRVINFMEIHDPFFPFLYFLYPILNVVVVTYLGIHFTFRQTGERRREALVSMAGWVVLSVLGLFDLLHLGAERMHYHWGILLAITSTGAAFVMRLVNSSKNHARILEQRVEERTIELNEINFKFQEEIYEREFAEKSLRESEEKFRALSEFSADGIMRFDRQHRHIYCNKAIVNSTGIPAEQWIGKTHREMGYPEEFSAICEDVIESVFRTGEKQRIEFQFPLNGSWVDWQISPEFSPDGVVTSVMTAARDITDMKKILLTLEESNRKLEELDRMKSDLMSIVSHELRTPLTSILGFTKISKKRMDEIILPVLNSDNPKVSKAVEQVKKNAGIIISEGERLTNLINDFLDLSKLESGKITWTIEPLNPREIIDSAAAATSSLFAKKPVELRVETSPELPFFDGDRDRLLQVMINLISNAAKFTDIGSVTVGAIELEGFIQFSIKDTGIGIDPENYERIFEKFQQIGDTHTNRPKGTGLGLPICKEIVEHLGGNIWVESSHRKGSAFFFKIPLKMV